MLTRHFYNCDEVVDSLKKAVLNKKVVDAAFWCQELIDSELDYLAFRTLLEIWLYYINFTLPEWIKHADTDTPNLQELCLNLALSDSRDSSIFYIICSQDQPIDRVVLDKGYKTDKNKVREFYRACLRQGRARSAWWIAANSYIDQDEIWEEVADSIRWIRSISESEKNSIYLCAGIVYTCGLRCKIESQKYIRLSENIVSKYVDKWSDKLGRRLRREFTIPIESIYGWSSRWRILKKDSNLSDLHEIEKTMLQNKSEDGIWNVILCDFELKGGEDDSREYFYQKYFPDDIPDEWSLLDQKKSHGSGMLRADENVGFINPLRWMRCWIGKDYLPRMAWGFDSIVIENISNLEYCSVLDSLDIYDLLMKKIIIWKSDINTIIKPVKRILEIQTPVK